MCGAQHAAGHCSDDIIVTIATCTALAEVEVVLWKEEERGAANRAQSP